MLPMFIFFKNGSQMKNYSTLTDDFYLVDRNITSTDRLNIILSTLTKDVSTSDFQHQIEKTIPIEKDDLIIYVNKESMECLNQSKNHKINDLLTNIEGKYLESQSDEQLLIFFTFTVRLALKQISFKGIDKKSCPALFVNDILDWGIDDPKDKSIDEVRKIRDDIENKVKSLDMCCIDELFDTLIL